MPFILAHAVYTQIQNSLWRIYINVFMYVPVSEGAADCYTYNNGV